MSISYFNNDQLRELILRLTRLTERGKLTWQSLGNSQYSFSAHTGSTAFTVESKDSDDLAPHILGVFETQDDDVKELETIDSSDMSAHNAEAVENLYNLVKRTVLRIDVVAKNILAQLDDLE